MAGDKRTVHIGILGDSKPAQKAFKDAGDSADSFGSKLAGIGSKAAAGFALVGAAAVAGLGALSVKSIMAASDFEEAMSKVGVVFGDSAGQIESFAKGAAQNLGMSSTAALSAAGTFGNLFTAMGIGQKPAADMSTSLITLAGDLASFNNMDPTEVLEKLRAGLTGETEPLKALGVNISAAAIEAKALEMGLGDLTGELTPAAKAQAAYALIMEQTATAQGDFARTKDGVANSMRVIKASFSDLTVQIGQRLLPVVTPLIVAFASKMPAAIDAAAKVMDWLTDKIRGPAVAAFNLIRDGVLTFIQAIQGNWADDSGIHPFHRIIGQVALVIREQVIPAIQTMAAFFAERLLPIFQSFWDTFTRVTAAISDGNWGEALKALFDGFVERIGLVGQLLLDLGQKLIDWVAPMIPPLLEKLGELAVSVGDWIINEGVPMLAEKLGQWIDAFVAWANDAIPPLLVKLGELLDSVGAWIADEGLPILFEKLALWGAAFVDWVGEHIVPLLESLGELLLAVGEWIVTHAVPEIAAKLLEWGKQFVDWVQPQIVPLLEQLGALLSSLGGWLIDTALPEIGAKLAEWGAAFIAWVAPQILPLLGELGTLLLDVGNWIVSTALPEIIGKLAQWGAEFIAWVAPQIPPLLVQLGVLLMSIAAWIISDGVPKLAEKLLEWAEEFLSWVADVVADLPGKLADILTAISGWVSDNAGSIIKAGADIAWNLLSGISGYIYDNASAIVGGAVAWIKSLLPSWFWAGLNFLGLGGGGGNGPSNANVTDPGFLVGGALPGTGGGSGGGGQKPVPPHGGGGVGGGGVKDPTHPIAPPPPPVLPPYSTLLPGGPSNGRGMGTGKGGGYDLAAAQVAAALITQGVPADVAVAAAAQAADPTRTYNGGAYTGQGGGNYIPGSQQAYDYAAAHGGVVLSGSGLVGYKRDSDADDWGGSGGLHIIMDGQRVGKLVGRRHMRGSKMKKSYAGAC